jgi:hypothetical protein
MNSRDVRMDRPDEVNWKSLRTASGTAQHIPCALYNLASAQDEKAIADAYWRLDNYIILQGTLYESAFFAIPYIVDILLTAHSVAQKVAAYDLLIEIARGVPDPNQRWSPPPGAPRDLRDACRHVIAPYLAEFQLDLKSGDESIRSRAMDLIASFQNLESN